MLKKGAFVDIRDDDYQTPLYHASSSDQKEITRVLLAHGALVDLGCEKSYSTDNPLLNNTSLMRASGVEIVEILVNHGANLNLANQHRRTALIFFIQSGREAIVEMLLAAGVVPTDKDLFLAVETGYINIVKLLLDYGASLKATVNGNTIVHHASAQNQVKILELLLNRQQELKDNEARKLVASTKELKYYEINEELLEIEGGCKMQVYDGYKLISIPKKSPSDTSYAARVFQQAETYFRRSLS